MSLPFALAPWLNRQFTDEDGVPIAGGFVETRVAGSATLKDTYADSDSVSPTANVNPVPLDADGRCTMFLEPGAYDFEVQDSGNVALYTVEGVEDVGLTFLDALGQELSAGARDVTSGYTIDPDVDFTVTVDSTGGADPCVINLPAVADMGQDLTIVNLGTEVLAITPNGAETINFVAAAYEVAISATPRLSMVTLRPDVESGSNWLVISEIVA